MKYNFEYLQPGDLIKLCGANGGFETINNITKAGNLVKISYDFGFTLTFDTNEDVCDYIFKVKDIRFFTRQKNSDNVVYITDDQYRDIINNYTKNYVSIDYGELSDGYVATIKNKPSYRLSTPEEIKMFKEAYKDKEDENKTEWEIGDKWKGFEVGKAYKHKKFKEYNVFCGLDKYEQPVFEHFTNNGVHINDMKSIVGTKKYWAYKGLENEFDLSSATNPSNINNQGKLKKKDEDESTKVEYFESIDDYSKATKNALVVAVSDDEPDYIVHTNTKEFCSEGEFEKVNCIFAEKANDYKYREPTEDEVKYFHNKIYRTAFLNETVSKCIEISQENCSNKEEDYSIYEGVFNPEKIKDKLQEMKKDKSSLIKVKHRYIPKH